MITIFIILALIAFGITCGCLIIYKCVDEFGTAAMVLLIIAAVSLVLAGIFFLIVMGLALSWIAALGGLVFALFIEVITWDD